MHYKHTNKKFFFTIDFFDSKKTFWNISNFGNGYDIDVRY